MSMLKQTLLVALAAASLAACGGDSSDDPAPEGGNGDSQARTGVYSGGYQNDEGDPQLATLVADTQQGHVLLIHDEEDRVSRYRAVADDAQIHFADAGDCTRSENGFACTLQGQALTLIGVPAGSLASAELASLAGDYTLLLAGDVLTLSVNDAGQVVFSRDGCDGEGRLFPLQDGALIGVEMPSQSCAGDTLRGVVELGTLSRTHDVLAVHVPGSDFSGFWLR